MLRVSSVATLKANTKTALLSQWSKEQAGRANAVNMFAKLFGSSKLSNTIASSSTLGAKHGNSGHTDQLQRQDQDYQDVALAASNGVDGAQQSPTSYDAPLAGRPSYSQAATSRGSFLGAASTTGPSSPNDYVTSVYPPVSTLSQPSSSSSSSSPTPGYPPLQATFARLHTLLREESPALLDSLSEPLAITDPAFESLFETISPYRLPPSVVESYQIHDGQDAFSSSAATTSSTGGLVWGLWWLSLDQVEQEWLFWREFEQSGGIDVIAAGDRFSTKLRSTSHFEEREWTGSQTRGTTIIQQQSSMTNEGLSSATTLPKDNIVHQHGQGSDAPHQTSFPPGWVRTKYSHPGWLPLLSDRCGNYIGIDLDPPSRPTTLTSPSSSSSSSERPLSPGSTNSGNHRSTNSIVNGSTKLYGQPGQVIAFGREIDDKVVLFPGDGHGGWGRFLASFVDDVERGEFAYLVESSAHQRRRSANHNNSVLNGSGRRRSNDWRDVEQGEDSEPSSPDSDEWGVGDGVGERSYFDTDRYGYEGDDKAGTEKQTWKLRPEYKKWLREDGTGGIIGVIAERSRRKWKSLGVGSRTPSATQTSHGNVTTQQPSARPPLSVVVPGSASIDDHDEVEPQSAVTVKPDTTQSHESPNVVLSPPTPGERTASKPDPFSTTSHHHHRRASSTDSKSTARSEEKRRDSLHPRDIPRQQQQQQQQQRRKRSPPPPPAMIGLPTVDDLDYGGPVSASVQRVDGGTRLSIERDTTRSSFNSVRSTSSNATSPTMTTFTDHINEQRRSSSKTDDGLLLPLARQDSQLALVGNPSTSTEHGSDSVAQSPIDETRPVLDKVVVEGAP
ncbi:Cell wall assembly regulator [Microbotryomycetes sp. JL221]|nr:Cell wall assembly regulator [Microbotryomycetes sp. JL221]